jgi:hypothetical protein
MMCMSLLLLGRHARVVTIFTYFLKYSTILVVQNYVESILVARSVAFASLFYLVLEKYCSLELESTSGVAFA